MKKILFALVAVIGLTVNAQNNSDSLAKSSWVIEINTGSWTTGGTGFSLASVDGGTAYSLGAEAGYFMGDNLALKVGLGYAGGEEQDGIFNYKLGVKYYISGKFPVGIDYTGSSFSGGSVSWVGLQGGYAWFVASNVSIEPTLRYNATLDSTTGVSAFQGLIGFAFHF